MRLSPYSDEQRVNNRTCWVFAFLLSFLMAGALSPTSELLERSRLLYVFLSVASLFGVYFAWGTIPFCTLIGTLLGVLFGSGFDGFNLLLALAASVLGLCIGVALDVIRKRSKSLVGSQVHDP